jgi:uncharacterized repeat protein (TIGR03803 family)
MWRFGIASGAHPARRIADSLKRTRGEKMKGVSLALFASMISFAFVQPILPADAVTYKEKVLHSFGGGTDGLHPFAAVIDVKGILYGTTSGGGILGGGVVFAVNGKTGAETTVYSFCSEKHCADGYNPSAGLIDVKGTLYGTTSQGGTGFDGQELGTAFALDPNTGSEKVLYSFCSLQNCPDGAYPLAGLINVNGVLYGTTQDGGTSINDYGTAFALDRKTGAETVLYSFCSQKNCTDGWNPNPALIAVNGTLYGTTIAGGTYGCGNGLGCGTVYSLDPNTGAETVLHAFAGGSTDGDGPEASLIAVNGTLYGTTIEGGSGSCGTGAYGCGTVFSLDPTTGAEKVSYSFCSRPNCTDGAEPFASLINVNETFYGTTIAGGGTGCGGYGCGTVFSIDPNTGAETVLYSFCSKQNCADGAQPFASLIAVNSKSGTKLYGTTSAGGTYGYGTVFVLKQTR